jgi:hypothetical protein
MYSKKILHLLLGITILFASACDKELKIQVPKDIYVAGSYQEGQLTQACYWKNGTLVKLGDGTKPSVAVSIRVKPNGDVVVAGTSGDDPRTAVYWLNGTITNVTNGQADADVRGLLVNGDSIILCGSEVYDGELSAAVWFKSNVVIGFNTYYTGASGTFTDVKMNGTHVAAVGYEIYNNNKVALYVDRVNGGGRTLLADSNINTLATALDIKNGEVFIAGVEDNGNASGGYNGVYWRNGVKRLLANNQGTLNVSTQNILFQNNNLYISGSKFDGTNFRPIIYTNGSQQSFTSPNGSDNLSSGLSVIGDKIFMAATEFSNAATPISSAVYWTNGAPTYLQPNNLPKAQYLLQALK